MVGRNNNLRRERVQLTLDQAVDHYLTAITLEGKSPETVLWHRKKLTRFAAFMRNGESPVGVCGLTLDDGRAFVKSLMEQETRYASHPLRHEAQGGLAPQTVHGFVRSIRTFASWLQDEGYTEDNVFGRLKPPKVPQVLIEPLTEDEIRLLLVAISQDTPEGARNYAIILLFLDTGVRLSELVQLKISGIDFGAGEFKVLGKGGKERIVPMGLATRRAVIRYIEHFRPQPVNSQENRLFLTVAGDPISRDSIAKMLERLGRRTGITRLHPHLLRHTFAVRYLLNGGDVFTLQKILGHTTLDMTRRYVTLANRDVKDKHRQYSPIDNLGLVKQRRGRPKRNL
ncbi:MAG: tyrosine-type recombinase/integrase [Thermoflexales bacterium]|nr:tyrosine-type recombinase/integrase [Thermoflexales bacterium]